MESVCCVLLRSSHHICNVHVYIYIYIYIYNYIRGIGSERRHYVKRMALGQNKCIYVKNILLYEKYKIVCAANANCIPVVSH